MSACKHRIHRRTNTVAVSYRWHLLQMSRGVHPFIWRILAELCNHRTPSSRLAFASAIVVVFEIPPPLLCENWECSFQVNSVRYPALGRRLVKTFASHKWAELFGPAAGLTKFSQVHSERPCQSYPHFLSSSVDVSKFSIPPPGHLFLAGFFCNRE